MEGIALAARVRPHPFEVSVDDLDRVKVVRVQGEVDAATAPRMGETVNRLLGMHERAQMFGGRVEIRGHHGKGTRAKVSIPLQLN